METYSGKGVGVFFKKTGTLLKKHPAGAVPLSLFLLGKLDAAIPKELLDNCGLPFHCAKPAGHREQLHMKARGAAAAPQTFLAEQLHDSIEV